MHLAKLEITRALIAVLDQLANLRLDPGKPAPLMQGSELRFPHHVFVRYDA